jgi:hypothetical protein
MHVSLNSERLISGVGVIVDYEPPPTLCMILCVFALGCLAIVFHVLTIVHRYPTFSLLTSEWFGGHRPFHLNFYSFIDVNSCTSSIDTMFHRLSLAAIVVSLNCLV